MHTKQSQWEKPTEPVYPTGGASLDAPPGYMPPTSNVESRSSMEKKTLGTAGFGSNNPYGASPGGSHISEDERLARQLQEEEEARARQHTGAGSSAQFFAQGSTPQPNQYAQQGYNASPYPQSEGSYAAPVTQDKGKSKGLLGKLLGKASGGSHSQGYPQHHAQPYGGQPGYGQQGYYPQQQVMYAQPGRRPGGGGMGMGGAAALGLGGGLLGGAMLGSALGDAGDGGDYGGDGGDGGDYGGDGGDFGGDGGGDMGGGDF
jgi:hypothetical protein